MTASFFPLQKKECGMALSISLAMHVALVIGLSHQASSNESLRSRRSGAAPENRLNIVMVSTTAVPQPVIKPTERQISRPRDTLRSFHRQTARLQVQQPPSPIAPAPATSAAAPVAAPAGSDYVSPFAPIISSPIGRSSWGVMMPPQINPENMQFLVEQARTQYRMALMDRLGAWTAQQAQQKKTVDCLIRLAMDSRQASLSCNPPDQTAELWSALTGLVVAGSAGRDDMLCLRAGTGQFGIVNCEEVPGS